MTLRVKPFYAVDRTARDVWRQVEERELMGTGQTAAALRKKGYRARKVQLWREL